MRDILFRGKRLDNGEWVEGDLVHSSYKIGDTCVGTYGSSLGMHQVATSTEASQATGIRQSGITSCCQGRYKHTHGYVFRYRGDKFRCRKSNIHDNPELLEGGESE